MAIAFDGTTKLITIDTDTSFNMKDIYDASVDWAVLTGNMQYLLPIAAQGKAPLGGSVYTDVIYILSNGWKLKPSGYADDEQITILGTIITDDGTIRTVVPTVGDDVSWIFQVATYGVIANVSSGSGLSTEEHNQLMKSLTVGKFVGLK